MQTLKDELIIYSPCGEISLNYNLPHPNIAADKGQKNHL